MTTDRLAHEIHIVYAHPEPDGPEPGIYIDGTRFPYFVSQDLDVEHGKSVFTNVKMEVFAASVRITDDHGVTRTPVTPTPEQETEWARRRAKEIVYEGLGDVIEWLARANYEREQKELAEERAEAVWSTQAWLNLAALVDGAPVTPNTDTLRAFLDQAPPIVRETAESVRKDAGL